MPARRSLRTDPRLWLALILLVALGLRLIDVGNRLNHDEGYSWLVASAGSASRFTTRLAHYENTPPLFYLLLSALPLTSEFWLRLPSLLAGTAQVGVLYLIVRPLLGVRAALLAALALAVAPFAVSYSDYSRGFMVAGLGLLGALLAAQRLACGGTRRWWILWFLGGTCALYSEYYSAVWLAVIGIVLLAIGAPRRRDVLLFGLLPLLAFLPWLPEMIRSLNDLGATKLKFTAGVPSVGELRNAIVPPVFGEHGSAASPVLRDVQALLVLGVLGWACLRLRRTASRTAFWLLAGVLVLAPIGHLLLTLTVTDIFAKRYLTTGIALGAAVLAGAVVSLRWRPALPMVAALLAVLGITVGVVRIGREYEPDAPLAVAYVEAHGYRTILTNSAVIAFYGRRILVVLDRPFGLGNGLERYCAPRCAVADDGRFGGVRTGPGPSHAVGPILIRFPPRER